MARVRNLHVNVPGTTVQAFQALIDPHGPFDPVTIWPKVKALHWSSPDNLKFMEHFLTLGIRNLDIYLEGAEDEDVLEVLGLMDSRCMDLEDLHLFDPLETREKEEIQDVIRQIIYNNSLTLKRLSPPQYLSASLVNNILTLPELEELEICFPEIPHPMPQDILPALKCLTVTVEEVPDFIDLFGTLRESKLAVFSLFCCYPTSPDDHEEMADFFEDTGLFASVEEFCWVPRPFGGGPTGEFVTTLESFANLQVLSLHASCGQSCSFGFHHKDIVELSKRMPLLKELNLGGSPCADTDTVPDIGYHTLAVLARNCRDLFLLTIHFNPKSFGFVPHDYMEPNWSVALWDVGDIAPPSHPVAVTMFALAVSKLFPRVVFKGEKTKYAREWDTIHEELRMITLPANHGLLN